MKTISYLGRDDLPRGMRNNNPGNIIKTNIQWVGKITPSSDVRFEQFQTMEYGLRALYKNLITKIKRYDGNIASIITEWAPPNENNTQGYIDIVTQRLGKRTVDLTRPDLIKLAEQIVKIENGNAGYLLTPEVYGRAFSLLDDEIPNGSLGQNKAFLPALLLFFASQA